MVTDFSEGVRTAFRAALALAEQDKAECLHVIAIRSLLTEARLAIESGSAGKNRETLLDEFAAIAADSPVVVEPRVIDSTTGVGAADFVKTIAADLLVMAATTCS